MKVYKQEIMLSVYKLLISIQNLETKAKIIELLKTQDAAQYNYGLEHKLDSFRIVPIY